jgi:hypothetical protein
MSGPSTGLVYFALLAAPDDVAARLSVVAGEPFDRVEGDADGTVLYRSRGDELTIELQNVDEWLEGTIYSLVALAPEDGPGDLDERLRELARAAGAARQWSHAGYRARQRERAAEPE